MPDRQAIRRAAPYEPLRRPDVETMRRAQIISAARACIAEKGFDAATIRDVAVAAGVSTGTVNYYFAGKDQLLISALEDLANEFGRRVREAAQTAQDDAMSTLEAVIEASLPLPFETPRTWNLWIEFWAQASRHDALGKVHAEIYHNWRRLIARAIRRGLDAGQFAAVEPDTVARQLAGLIDGLAIQSVAGDPEVPAEEVRRLCRDYLRTTLRPA